MQRQLLSKNNLKVPNTVFPEEAFSKNFLLFGAFVKASEVVLLILFSVVQLWDGCGRTGYSLL